MNTAERLCVNVQRAVTSEEFRSLLAPQYKPVLPLWGGSGLGKETAYIIPNAVAYRLQRHPVIGERRDLSGPLAERYAHVLERPFYSVDELDQLSKLSRPAGITCFPPISMTRPYEWLVSLRSRLHAALGTSVPIGVLTAEDVSTLSWLLAKQIAHLAGRSAKQQYKVALVDNLDNLVGEPVSPAPLRILRGKMPSQEILDAVGGADTLILNVHSRPHCGRLFNADGGAGICASPTHGENGLCVGATPCFYADRPKLILENLPARRIFYNGCYTARLGNGSQGMPSYEANHVFAAFRGRAVELVGNLRPGRYTANDALWFVALSSLNYSPAQAVEIIDRRRAAEDRELQPSLVYLGDSVHSPWDVLPTAPGLVAETREGLEVTWNSANGLLAICIAGRRWTDLADSRRLDVKVHCANASGARVSLADDPFEDLSIMMVVLEQDTWPDAQEVRVTLRERSEPVLDPVGSVLSPTLKRLQFLSCMPSLSATIGNAVNDLFTRLVALRQLVDQREDVAHLEDRIVRARAAEIALAESCDLLLVAEACRRSVNYWDWHQEYTPYVRSVPRPDSATCFICGQCASTYEMIDRLDHDLRRHQIVCITCSIIADLPAWDLELTVAEGSVITQADRFCCRIEINNPSAIPRHIAIGPQLFGFQNRRKDSSSLVETLLVPARGTAEHFVDLRPQSAFLGFTWVRIYVASRGDLGFLGMPAFFQAPGLALPNIHVED